MWVEANMVAKTVNGRQIRGWYIVSKMVAFRWENWRSVVLRQSGSRMMDGEICKVDGKINIVMGGKCFLLKISNELSSIDSVWLKKILGMIPREVPRFDGRGVCPLTVMEEKRKVSDDRDKTVQMDSYERAVVLASPIPCSLNFKNVVEKDKHRRKVVVRMKEAGRQNERGWYNFRQVF
ncbi:hypothetical protein Ddye_011534 [Dipteronia dyeriana]|uniref:Uncharacterized protein n=1 Tax=Dipteronia dyeriana TaxID=168575 RepID=A0AAD9X2P0_9ROSI|nr:hypothetical protein Ddye_011534 [Dipteronia dyeriana]